MVVFSDGFESNDFSAWTGTNGTPAVTGTAHTGAKGMECDDAADWAYEDPGNTDPCYARCYVRVDTLPGAWQGVELLELADVGTGTIAEWRLMNAGGPYKIKCTRSYPGWAEVWSAAIAVAVDTWYRFEVAFDSNNGAGFYKAWWGAAAEGAPDLSETALDTSGATCDRVEVGTIARDYALTGNFDCVVIDTSYIGEEAAGISIPVAMHHYGHTIAKIIRG
jgi:hypothetical protein